MGNIIRSYPDLSFYINGKLATGVQSFAQSLMRRIARGINDPGKVYIISYMYVIFWVCTSISSWAVIFLRFFKFLYKPFFFCTRASALASSTGDS